MYYEMIIINNDIKELNTGRRWAVNGGCLAYLPQPPTSLQPTSEGRNG